MNQSKKQDILNQIWELKKLPQNILTKKTIQRLQQTLDQGEKRRIK